jgi:DNA-binding response OmpR family regulator
MSRFDPGREASRGTQVIDQGRIVVVDDDRSARVLLRTTLALEGFDVRSFGEGAGALQALRQESADLVIVDMVMPGVSGLDLIEAVTEAHRGPIVVVSGVDAEKARVRALEVGADDFILKPPSAPDLVARVRAVLRRSRRVQTASVIEVGELAVDVDAREVRVNGSRVELTVKEFDLLAFMAARPGQAFTRHQLLVSVWQSASEWQSAATVTEHVRRVRLKIEPDPGQPRHLVTVRGVGYRFARGQIKAA